MEFITHSPEQTEAVGALWNGVKMSPMPWKMPSG